MKRSIQKAPVLPQQLANLLRQEISQQYRAGDKLETVRALSRQHGVSVNTMRAALLVLAHEGLINTRQGSGMYVKEPTDQRPVGVLMEIDFSCCDLAYFFRRVTQQVRLRLTAAGQPSRLYAGFCQPANQPLSSTCPEFLEDVRQNKLRGLVVTYGQLLPDLKELLRQNSVPVVGNAQSLGFEHAADLDYPAMVREATQRLLKAGRRKLAFIDWAASAHRLEGRNPLLETFARELADNGVSFNHHWVRSDLHPSLTGAGWEEFREIWTAQDDKPDGLLVANDVLFRGAARAIVELGIRVPDQLLVITHANKGANESYPFPVWQLEADPDVFAQAQVDLMVALLQNQPVPQPRIVLPFQFVDTQETTAEPLPVGGRDSETASTGVTK